jgi:hypothetical protein
MNKSSLIAGSIGTLCALLAVRAAYAEDPRLQGSFVSMSRSDKAIADAIDKSVADFNFVARPIARSRLKKANPTITQAVFLQEGADVAVTLGAQKPARAAAGAAPVKWTRNDGETFDVKFAWEGSTLVQSFTAADGVRHNRYTLSADGNTLSVNVSLHSDQLKVPVTYQLAMSREMK